MIRLRAGDRLLLASHNKGKLKEIAELVEPHGISVVSAADLGLTEPVETEDSFRGNALLKARHAATGGQMIALSDDSGLAVRALGGAPGVYTADWAETAHGRDWQMAMAKVEEKLGQSPDRYAEFVCTLALVTPAGEEAVFEGRCAGTLVWPPRGTRGFGYDPVFLPEGETETFGEMDPARKAAISHRADAFRKLCAEVLGDES